MTEDNALAIYTVQEDEEYAQMLVELEKKYPKAAKGFDFSKIGGSFEFKTGKALVLHLSLAGWRAAEIAEALDLPEKQIARYVTDAIAEAIDPLDADSLRHKMWAELMLQRKLMFEQWNRSCQDEVTETETWVVDTEDGVQDASPDDPGARRVVKRITKPQTGNPAYQRAMIDALKQIDKLLGVSMPTKIEVDKTERRLQITEVVVTSREQVEEAKRAGLLK